MIKNKFPMGQRVSFTAVSIAYTVDSERTRKAVRQFPRQGSGIICGTRQLQEGCMDSGANEYGEMPRWYASKYVDVYLVAVNYGQLVRVQPEDITAEVKS